MIIYIYFTSVLILFKVEEYISKRKSVPDAWPRTICDKLLDLNTNLGTILGDHIEGSSNPRDSYFIGPPLGNNCITGS